MRLLEYLYISKERIALLLYSTKTMGLITGIIKNNQ